MTLKKKCWTVKNTNLILKDDYVENVKTKEKGIVTSVFRAKSNGRLIFEVSYLRGKKIEEREMLRVITKKAFTEDKKEKNDKIPHKEGHKWKRLFGTIFGWLF